MVTCACVIAILIGAFVGQAADAQPPKNPDVLLSTSQALVGVDQLCVVLAMRGFEEDARLIEVPKLKARIVDKLSEAGIKQVKGETGLVPKLIVRIESTPLPDCDKYVWRVQISLTRLVTLPDPPDSQIQAEVWQARPVMEVAAKQAAAGAISTAVLAQVEAFVAAHKAARSLLTLPHSVKQDVSAPPAVGQAQSSPQGLKTAAGYPFVSSKSSQVFHRPDCRWAQNIASGNLIGYKSREEAVQAGKRPCKTCKP
jgi:hypothetical protein